jgi:hypothetical protein
MRRVFVLRQAEQHTLHRLMPQIKRPIGIGFDELALAIRSDHLTKSHAPTSVSRITMA